MWNNVGRDAALLRPYLFHLLAEDVKTQNGLVDITSETVFILRDRDAII